MFFLGPPLPPTRGWPDRLLLPLCRGSLVAEAVGCRPAYAGSNPALGSRWTHEDIVRTCGLSEL